MKFKVNAVPVILEQNGKLLKTAVYEIGVWNMDADLDVFVGHSLDLTKVVSIKVMIINDAESYISNLDSDTVDWHFAGGMAIRPTDFHLWRQPGKFFDTVNYDDAVMNRGYVWVEYFD